MVGVGLITKFSEKFLYFNTMNLYYKNKKVEKLGGFLQGKMKKSFLWRGIEASQVAKKYAEIANKNKILKGTRFVSWRNGDLKIKANSAAQRQEIILKKEMVESEMKNKKIEVKEIKVLI